jgi:imidazole glycerol-phosphate synthase subunit HisH
MIAIIDYGMGNLCSVQKALEKLGASVKITSSSKDLAEADKIILPGVGAFGDAMAELEKCGLVESLKKEVRKGKTFLGICLGLQVLFEESEECPGVKGLGILPGKVKRFVTELKVPHMGWNQLHFSKKAPILEGIDEGAYVYFVHSYYVAPERDEDISTTTDYALNFTSSVWRGNLFATQFHPEKSQSVGLKILENFIKLEI